MSAASWIGRAWRAWRRVPGNGWVAAVIVAAGISAGALRAYAAHQRALGRAEAEADRLRVALAGLTRRADSLGVLVARAGSRVDTMVVRVPARLAARDSARIADRAAAEAALQRTPASADRDSATAALQRIAAAADSSARECHVLAEACAASRALAVAEAAALRALLAARDTLAPLPRPVVVSACTWRDRVAAGGIGATLGGLLGVAVGVGVAR